MTRYTRDDMHDIITCIRLNRIENARELPVHTCVNKISAHALSSKDQNKIKIHCKKRNAVCTSDTLVIRVITGVKTEGEYR